MSFQAILKVGGSLGRGQALPALCQEIGRLGASHPLLVVPGGGEFADQVRLAYRRYQLSETAAHQMALLAMDQYGFLLSELIPHSVLVSDLPSAHRLASAAQTPILLPSALLRQADPLPHSWEITSDTIAAWIARYSGTSRLILLKDVDGLFSTCQSSTDTGELILETDPVELDPYLGGVDEAFATFLRAAQLEIWVINGLQPARLAELLAAGQTLGTHIRPPATLSGDAA